MVFKLIIKKEKQEIVKFFDTEEEAQKEIEFYKDIYKPEVKLKFEIKRVKVKENDSLD